MVDGFPFNNWRRWLGPCFRRDDISGEAHPLSFSPPIFSSSSSSPSPKTHYGAARFAFGEIEFMINIKGFA